MLETHILRSQIDKGSNILLLLGDVHAAACGLQSKDCGPSMHPGDFVDSLKRDLCGHAISIGKAE